MLKDTPNEILLACLFIFTYLFSNSHSQPATEIMEIPNSTITWEFLTPPDGQKFSPRNG